MPPEILAKLRHILAKLYTDEASIRRVITDAHIDPVYIPFNNSAINIWHSVLAEAQKTERLVALLDVAETEYASNSEFCEVSILCRSILDPKPQKSSQVNTPAQRQPLRRRFSSETRLDEDAPPHHSLGQQNIALVASSPSPTDGSLLRFTAVYRHDGISADEVRPIYDNGQHIGDCGLSISSNNGSIGPQRLGANQVVVLEVWLAEFANRKSTRRPHILLTVDEETKNQVYAQNPTAKLVKVRVAKVGLCETVKGHRLTLECVVKQVSLLPASGQSLISGSPDSVRITFLAIEVELSVWGGKTKHL